MSSALPNPEAGCCLTPCDDVVVQNIPGPEGPAGADGADGTDGISAVTTLTAAYTMPAELGSAVATVASTAGLSIGETVFVQALGTLQVTAIGSSVLVTLKNLEDTANSAYTSNFAPGTIAPIGSRVVPTGLQGPSGLLSGAAAGGQLKGTYPNPKLAIPNSLGALIAGDGTDAASLSAGTNGQIPAYDSTQPLGILPKSIIPITGGTNVAINRVTRLSSATGTPIPIAASKATINDVGGAGIIIADATTGNARGIDAVDLQVGRPVVGASAVASGDQSVICGGQDNTASGARSFVGGGEKNNASGQESVIGGGDGNQVDSTQGTIAGGDTNSITGGSANESSIGGGRLNAITGSGQATISGGIGNAVSSLYGTISGGNTNIVSGIAGAVAGGLQATADKYGQRAFSAGRFAAQADCQQSDLIWRIATTTNTAGVEAFLDGSASRATIPNNTTWAFDLLCVGRSDAGVSAAWTVKGAIQNNAGTTALVAAVTVALLADGSGGTWGAVGNAPVASADSTNDSLKIAVTGASATNIRWTIHGRIQEVSY